MNQVNPRPRSHLFILLIIWFIHPLSFTVTVKNRKRGKGTCHCGKARPYRADKPIFKRRLPVVRVKSEMAV